MTPHDVDLLFGGLGLQILSALGIGLCLLWMFRWMRARSARGAQIFAAGLLLRAGLGVALFWISWLDLAFLRDLHMGNGFWILASDAPRYMGAASRAALEGFAAIKPGEASPAYVATVALWMRLVGVSPFSGMYLNLVVYSALCTSLVALWRPKNDWRADLPLLVLLGAFSLSPVLIIHGSQSLKDDVFAFVIAVGAVGALLVSMPAVYGFRAVGSRWAFVAGAAAWLGAVFYAAGIRAYFAFFMLCSLGAVLAFFSARPRWDALHRRIPITAAVCLLTGWVYMAGAGPYDFYLRTVLAVFQAAPEDRDGTGLTSLVIGQVNTARRGFAQTGGATSLASPRESAQPRAAPAGGGRAVADPTSLGGYVSRVSLGLATLFVPISLLQALAITNFTGGRGLLFVTDIDTLFVDVTMLASLGLLYLRWNVARRRLPFVCFLLLLGTATTLLLAYVVTNFGTLFRLRMLAVIPFWLLLLATADSRLIPAAPDEDVASRPAPRDTPG